MIYLLSLKCGGMNHVTEVLQSMAINWWGREVTLYIKKMMDYIKLSLKNNYELGESLWVKIKGQTNKGNLVAVAYGRLPDQREDVNGVFFSCRKHHVPRI